MPEPENVVLVLAREYVDAYETNNLATRLMLMRVKVQVQSDNAARRKT
jgi:hypothetical protein